MRQLRVLAFSAAFGAGHIRAADAVIGIIQERFPQAQILHMDFGVVLSKTFTRMIKNTYIEVIKHTPSLWGTFYRRTSRLQSDSVINRLINGFGSHDFLRFINSFEPDVIICTYPTVAGILGQLRLKKILGVPLVTIVTDYTAHSQWIHPGVDLYIVGSSEIRGDLITRGVNPQKIKVTGIPISPRFEEELDRRVITSQLGLETDRRTVMVMGGAEGLLEGAKGICKTLTNDQIPVQSIVVCGKDEKLYRSLDEVILTAKNPILRYGYVENIEELMTAADLIITKAGGLTVTEALTKHIPMLIYKPIPGQEEENAKFVQRIGAGVISHSLEQLNENLSTLLTNPQLLDNMRLAAAGAVPEQAAVRAAENILNLTEYHEIRSKTG